MKRAKSVKISKSTKSAKNRRRRQRWQVAVLVRCSIPKFSEGLFELEMWAKDVNEDGLKLEVTRGLNVSRVNTGNQDSDSPSVRFEDIEFKKGTKLKIQDLFYDDDGSPFINGQVQWARRSPAGIEIGVQLTDGKAKTKAVAGSFKDFLSIVKNPLDAIEKASRK
jgi:hypothetical protein